MAASGRGGGPLYNYHRCSLRSHAAQGMIWLSGFPTLRLSFLICEREVTAPANTHGVITVYQVLSKHVYVY